MGFTTRPGSSGLGLAMVRHIVSQTGGTAFAQRIELGARVVVRLPRLR